MAALKCNSDISESETKQIQRRDSDDSLEFSQGMFKIIRKVTESYLTTKDSKKNKMIETLLNQSLRNNIGGGKMTRGLMVTTAYKNLVQKPTTVDLNRAQALGWVLEMIQATCHIADNYINPSDIRHGKSCCDKNAFTEMSATEPYYRQLYKTIAQILHFTVFGKSLACLTEKAEVISKEYAMERYNTIVKYKSSYNTMYAPVVLAIIMAGQGNNFKLLSKVEEITIRIGHYCQVQDDYLDCFEDREETGANIQDQKCSWLFVKAKEMCTKTQLKVLLENYGKNDEISVEDVKNLYIILGLKTAYQDFEADILEEIKQLVDGLQTGNEDNGGFVSTSFFIELLDKLYKRREGNIFKNLIKSHSSLQLKQ